MTVVLYIILGFVIAYLLGSIPTAVWYGRSAHGVDVREHGSGNAGATNTFRVLGKKAGILVMAIDIFKGFVAASIPLVFFLVDLELTESREVQVQLLYGMGAVLGHIFPLYAGFKGGKGVATLLGMVIGINYLAALGCIAVFLIVFLISKYVSLSSMLAGLAFPLLLLVHRIFEISPSKSLIGFGFVLFVLLVITHRKNIKRLIDGEESRANISFGKK